ncbi:MAG: SRPBCC domain-containing protein [Chloroflexota bacterium]
MTSTLTPSTTPTTPSIEREITIAARPEIIFAYFTDPERMARWLVSEATLDARPGGSLSLLVAGQHRASGHYVDIDPPRRVVFTFGWEGEGSVIPPGRSRVEIDLTPAGQGTILRFRHVGVPEITLADHTHGWEHYLGRLSIAAAGGDPGPDTNADQAADDAGPSAATR